MQFKKGCFEVRPESNIGCVISSSLTSRSGRWDDLPRGDQVRPQVRRRLLELLRERDALLPLPHDVFVGHRLRRLVSHCTDLSGTIFDLGWTYVTLVGPQLTRL